MAFQNGFIFGTRSKVLERLSTTAKTGNLGKEIYAMQIDEFTNPAAVPKSIVADIHPCPKCGYRWVHWRMVPGLGDYECYDCHPPVSSNDFVTASPTVREWAWPIVGADGELIEWKFGSRTQTEIYIQGATRTGKSFMQSQILKSEEESGRCVVVASKSPKKEQGSLFETRPRND